MTRVTQLSVFHLNCLHQFLSIYESAHKVLNMLDPSFQSLISRLPVEEVYDYSSLKPQFPGSLWVRELDRRTLQGASASSNL